MAGVGPVLVVSHQLHRHTEAPAARCLHHGQHTREQRITIERKRRRAVAEIGGGDARSLRGKPCGRISENRHREVARAARGLLRGRLHLALDVLREPVAQSLRHAQQPCQHVAGLHLHLGDGAGLGHAVLEGDVAGLDLDQSRQLLRLSLLHHGHGRIQRRVGRGGVVGGPLAGDQRDKHQNGNHGSHAPEW